MSFNSNFFRKRNTNKFYIDLFYNFKFQQKLTLL